MVNRIYTKTGDKGETSLLSGERVPKSHARVEAYGTVDELNANLGLVAAGLEAAHNSLLEPVRTIQSCLFRIGSWLAVTPDSDVLNRLPGITESDIRLLESGIDRMQSAIPPLASFILPGGDTVSARVHVARTVCRRAERRLVALIAFCGDESGSPADEPDLVMQYLNRLADYLFVLARFINFSKGISDHLWEKQD